MWSEKGQFLTQLVFPIHYMLHWHCVLIFVFFPFSFSPRELGIIPKTNIVELEPSDDLINKNHLEPPPLQLMYIMADLSPRERWCSVVCEVFLASGVICMELALSLSLFSSDPDLFFSRLLPSSYLLNLVQVQCCFKLELELIHVKTGVNHTSKCIVSVIGV